MRKILFCLIAVLMISNIAFANDFDDARNERDGLQDRLIQYEQAERAIRVRIVELNGIIKYLSDKKAEEQKLKEAEAKKSEEQTPEA